MYWTCRCINLLRLWHTASETSDIRLPPQSQDTAAWRLVPTDTAWWQRHIQGAPIKKQSLRKNSLSQLLWHIFLGDCFYWRTLYVWNNLKKTWYTWLYSVTGSRHDNQGCKKPRFLKTHFYSPVSNWPWGKKLKGRGYENRYGCIVATEGSLALLRSCATAASVWLHVVWLLIFFVVVHYTYNKTKNII